MSTPTETALYGKETYDMLREQHELACTKLAEATDTLATLQAENAELRDWNVRLREDRGGQLAQAHRDVEAAEGERDRLRERLNGSGGKFAGDVYPLERKAAEERLHRLVSEQENKRLREALQSIIDHPDHDKYCDACVGRESRASRALAAIPRTEGEASAPPTPREPTT